jgi:2-keto-4-pentenoate hydratase/2-oxohepta-3-ene-1,7-dioic acid hydratase in catechol pathway
MVVEPMRLASVRQSDGATRLWAADHEGAPYYDVAAAAATIHPEFMEIRDVGSLYRAGLRAIDVVREVVSGLRSNRDGQDLSTLKLAPPVTNPGSIVCVGRNYLAHVGESDAPVPELPLLFSKFPNALVGHEEGVVLHSLTCELDYEGELAVVIGQEARHVARDDAMSYVAGYTVLNDISARDLQRSDLQWIRGKSLDTFCPLGPVFVTSDEITDVSALRIETHVNGELRQSAPVSDMIFPIPELVEFITEGITLHPGDVIATGTPSGTALGMKPPVWLQAGDVVEVTIAPIGRLQSTIEGPR